MISRAIVLGVLGATIDIASGYLFLTQSMITTNDMGVMITGVNYQGIGWSAGLFSLGALILITTFLGASSFGKGRMRNFGYLMVIYGIVMLLIGTLMYSGMTPMMEGSLYSSLGMFIVGVLMIANGAIMTKTMTSKMALSMRSPAGLAGN